MARVLKPSFCPLSSLFAGQSVETKACRDSAQFWAWDQRQVKTDERAQPFGAVGRSIQCGGYCSIRRPARVLSRSEVLCQTFCPRFPEIINQQSTTKSKVEAQCASA